MYVMCIAKSTFQHIHEKTTTILELIILKNIVAEPITSLNLNRCKNHQTSESISGRVFQFRS